MSHVVSIFDYTREERRALGVGVPVLRALILFGLLLTGCRPAGEPAKSEPESLVAPTPAAPVSEPESLVAPTPAAPVSELPVLPAGIPREALLYRNTILRETRFYWVEPGMRPAVFFAQIHQESRFKATAKSKYATGLAQFTPATAEGYQKAYPKDLQVLCPQTQGCPLDPHWAIRAGVIYDRDMYRVYKFALTPTDRWGFTLAAYNGGAGWIDRELRVCKASPVCDSTAYFPEPGRKYPLGVQDVCGKSTPARADWACKENTEYPNIILFRWRPLYETWLGPLNYLPGVP